MLPIFINILLVIHVIVSLLIVLLVLMQRPKSEGLGAAFGGGMTDNLFGAQTTNVLQNFTRWMGLLFFALTLTLSVLYAKQSRSKTGLLDRVKKDAALAPVVVPATSGSAATAAPAEAAVPNATPIAVPAAEAPAPAAPAAEAAPVTAPAATPAK